MHVKNQSNTSGSIEEDSIDKDSNISLVEQARASKARIITFSFF